MTLEELKTGLVDTGLPVVYYEFKESVTPPYIAYMFDSSDDLKADNKNYKDISDVNIELYTTKKDLTSEGLLEAKLKEMKLPYYKIENWIESEKLFQILYQVRLI